MLTMAELIFETIDGHKSTVTVPTQHLGDITAVSELSLWSNESARNARQACLYQILTQNNNKY